MMAAAQGSFRYTFTTQTAQTYTALTTGATSLNGSTIWDDEDFSAALPFTFRINGVPTNTLSLSAANIIYADTSTTVLNAFLVNDADLHDRANATGGSTPLSPIRYRIDGTAPNRIFKVEVANAGFYDNRTSNTDSVNYQVWMYEGSNIIEVRFGQSSVTAGSTYYGLGGTGPVIGVADSIDLSGTSTRYIYYLRGNPTAPTVDSLDIFGTPSAVNALNSWPAQGIVYRFTPAGSGGTSLADAIAAARALRLYPTVVTSQIQAAWGGTAPVTYEIISAAGTRVAAGTLQRGAQTIPVNNLAAGVYHLRIPGGSQQFVKQ